MKHKKKHNVGAILKPNSKIVEREANSIPLTRRSFIAHLADLVKALQLKVAGLNKSKYRQAEYARNSIPKVIWDIENEK